MADAVIRIAPSLMCADFLDLGAQLEVMAAEGVDYLHVDIMDGHYVPNHTLGLDFCRKLAASSKIPLDIHLMIDNPDELAGAYADLPGAVVSIHPETAWHPLRTLELIRSQGARPGIVIEPAMPVAAVRELLPHIDLACVMTVNPGYAGQRLIAACLPKIRELADLVASSRRDVEIEVDGNVSWDNVPRMVSLGATVLVAGSSSVFDGADLGKNLRRIRALVGRNV